jgi:hypothetical protein
MPRDGFEPARKAKVLRPSALKRIAKMEIKNEKDIINVMNTISDAVNEFLAYIAYTKAYEILEKDWYGRMEPKYYNRTKDLLTALNVTKDSKGHYNLGIDARALRQTPRDDYGEMGNVGSLGQHTGFDGEPVGAEIWTYINFGNHSSKISYEGINIIKQVEDYLNQVAPKVIRKFLKDNNIELKS